MIINYWTRDNVKVRALEESDMDFFIKMRNSPDSVREFMEDFIELPKSEKDLKKEFESTLEEYSKGDKRIFVIETKESEFAGLISIWYTYRRNGFFKYGIYVDENFRGQRIATSALIIVLDFYFNELNYHKASPMVYSFNDISQKFHTKFGFILEGRIRQEHFTRGNYYDMLYYGMTKDEFNSLYSHFEVLN